MHSLAPSDDIHGLCAERQSDPQQAGGATLHPDVLPTPPAALRRVMQTYLCLSTLATFADMTLTVTLVLLLQARGMSSQAVCAVMACVWLVEGVCEVPTGIIADMLGRRLAVLVSFALRAVGYGALFCTPDPTVAVLGTLVAAVGVTFQSGALEAWVVDAVREHPAGGLDRLFARARVCENLGLLTGTMFGAALGTLNLAWPHLLAGTSCAVGVCLTAIRMTESPQAGSLQSRGRLLARLQDSTRVITVGARRTLQRDTILLGLICSAAALWLFRSIPGVQWTVNFAQVLGENTLWLGVMRSSSALLEIPCLFGIMRVQRHGHLARRRLLSVLACTGALCLLTAALAPSTVVRMGAYVGFALAFGLCLPGVQAAINERIVPQHRATVLSVASLCNSLCAGTGLTLVGTLLPNLSSVHLSWPLAAIGFAIAGVVTSRYAARPPALATVSTACQT